MKNKNAKKAALLLTMIIGSQTWESKGMNAVEKVVLQNNSSSSIQPSNVKINGPLTKELKAQTNTTSNSIKTIENPIVDAVEIKKKVELMVQKGVPEETAMKIIEVYKKNITNETKGIVFANTLLSDKIDLKSLLEEPGEVQKNKKFKEDMETICNEAVPETMLDKIEEDVNKIAEVAFKDQKNKDVLKQYFEKLEKKLGSQKKGGVVGSNDKQKGQEETAEEGTDEGRVYLNKIGIDAWDNSITTVDSSEITKVKVRMILEKLRNEPTRQIVLDGGEALKKVIVGTKKEILDKMSEKWEKEKLLMESYKTKGTEAQTTLSGAIVNILKLIEKKEESTDKSIINNVKEVTDKLMTLKDKQDYFIEETTKDTDSIMNKWAELEKELMKIKATDKSRQEELEKEVNNAKESIKAITQNLKLFEQSKIKTWSSVATAEVILKRIDGKEGKEIETLADNLILAAPAEVKDVDDGDETQATDAETAADEALDELLKKEKKDELTDNIINQISQLLQGDEKQKFLDYTNLKTRLADKVGQYINRKIDANLKLEQFRKNVERMTKEWMKNNAAPKTEKEDNDGRVDSQIIKPSLVNESNTNQTNQNEKLKGILIKFVNGNDLNDEDLKVLIEFSEQEKDKVMGKFGKTEQEQLMGTNVGKEKAVTPAMPQPSTTTGPAAAIQKTGGNQIEKRKKKSTRKSKTNARSRARSNTRTRSKTKARSKSINKKRSRSKSRRRK